MSDEEEETPPRSSTRALIEEVLRAVALALEGIPDGARSRELWAKAESFGRVLHAWDIAPPTGVQLETLRELVSRLHDRALETVADVISGESVVPVERAHAGASPARGRNVSLEPLVLVVEDDGDTRRSVRQCLEEDGYCVEEATDGRAALERLERGPRPALILLDLMMPVMNGQTLLRELEARPELASLPVVVMTASGVDEATSALEVPMLRKPVDAAALLRIVEQYSPRFWDEEEVTTEELPIVPEVPRNETPRQICGVCRHAAETRCARCSGALCRACLAAGSAGVCARCTRR